MGLEMSAYKTSRDIGEVDFGTPDDAVEIAYWWQHPNLHGWMEELYRDKGGCGSFNCVPVKLEAADLDALEQAVRADALPPTTGFFFGESRADHKLDDICFIRDARESLGEGLSVFYTSWW